MKKLALLLAILTALTVFAGCKNEPASTNAATTAPAATSGGGSTTAPPTTAAPISVRTELRVPATSDVSTMDPHNTTTGMEGTITNLIYDRLLRKVYEYDENGNTRALYQPRLAESWEFSDDFLTVTFYIKRGVKFQNGAELKASDVVFSLNRCMESPAYKSKVENMLKAEAIDDYTVVVTLAAVTPTYLENTQSICIVNEAYVTEKGDAFADEPMGTGPFILSGRVPMQSFEFTAFEDYYRGAAQIKTISFDILPDSTAALMAFEAGSFDQIGVPSESVDRIKAAGKWKIIEMPSTHPHFVIINFENEFLSDVRVRQALHYATNKANGVALARDGYGKEAISFFNPELMINTTMPDNAFTYDLAKAKQLLAEAGYPDGAGAPTLTIKTIAGAYEKTALVLQQDYSELGLDVKIEVAEAKAFSADITTGNFDLSINGASVSDLVYPWRLLFISDFLDAANFSRNIDPVIDDLFARLGSTMDEDEQRMIIKDIINYVNDNVVYLPVTYGVSVTAYELGLEFDTHPRSVELYDMYWTK